MDLQPILAGLGRAPGAVPDPMALAGGGAAPRAMTEAAADFANTLRAAEAQAQAAVTTGADPHALVTAMAEGKLAVETVVAVRDRVVEAYQEILRMPV